MVGVRSVHGGWEQTWSWTFKSVEVQYEELRLYPEGKGESGGRVLSKRVTQSALTFRMLVVWQVHLKGSSRSP